MAPKGDVLDLDNFCRGALGGHYGEGVSRSGILTWGLCTVHSLTETFPMMSLGVGDSQPKSVNSVNRCEKCDQV